ncbi:TATA-box-binding protein [Halorubrum sp. AJ67]|uniref:TATA-box-binding protein n=1 Tax=Halorubrum sp. AJ67 TaxID=1173487 RepID=UPI001896695F|nr:TATA-box-binding protein [Halorubrum sp. AJ67]
MCDYPNQDSIKIVNIVTSGGIDREINLEKVANDIKIFDVNYDPSNFPGVVIKTAENGSTILLFRSGKFTVTGSSTQDEVKESIDVFSESLLDLGIINSAINRDQYDIVNLVCSAEVEIDEDLNSIAIILGIENVEYEPEISPFIIYRPPNHNCVMTIAGSGRIVVTGMTSLDTAKEAVIHLEKILNQARENS